MDNQTTYGVWVKASEGLPDSYDAHEKHVRLNGKKVQGIFIEGPEGGLVFEYREPVGGYRIIKDLSNIEWLDESTHPLQEKIDGLREALESAYALSINAADIIATALQTYK